jgi:hypothetical protein
VVERKNSASILKPQVMFLFLNLQATNMLLIDSLITNGSTYACVSENTDTLFKLTASSPPMQAVSSDTRQILLICTSVMMCLSALACVIALCMCLWRKFCLSQQRTSATEAWMNRVTVTWPDPDPSIPALADQMVSW